jgi:phosphopantothenoylcysteine decarboxylase / phosphopantothenate---cysteine ligase
MGASLAQAAKNAGADVVLVTGPVNIHLPNNVKIIKVVSAEEMFEAVTGEFAHADVCIMALLQQ